MLKGLLLVSVIGWSADALACSCASPPPVFFPRDGSVGVPTNVQFLFSPSEGQITLNAGLGVVAVFNPVGIQRVAPPMPLEPDTDYVFSFGQSGQITNFRTGPGPDITPPSITDFQFTSYGDPAISLGRSSCGYREWISFQPVATDDATPIDQLQFDFHFGPTPATVDLTSARLILAQGVISEGGCGPKNFPMSGNPRIAGALTAVDWAGNRSTPSPIHILKGCGCASGSDALSLTALGLLLLASRRRRSS